VSSYHHTQRAPLCLLLYGLAIAFFVLTWVLQQEPVLVWVFPTNWILCPRVGSFVPSLDGIAGDSAL
jgi:hypothetical protein